MLTQDDVTWIRANRTEILTSRTESITVWHAVAGGTDPYTNEPIAGEPVSETTSVVWKPVTERDLVDGAELQIGDVKVSFLDTVNLADVERVEKSGIQYELVTIDERGLGGRNRFECVVRQVT